MQTETFSHHFSSTVARVGGPSTPQQAAEIPTLLPSRNDTFFPENCRVMTQTLSLTPHGQTSAPRSPAQPKHLSTAVTREAAGRIPRPADGRHRRPERARSGGAARCDTMGQQTVPPRTTPPPRGPRGRRRRLNRHGRDEADVRRKRTRAPGEAPRPAPQPARPAPVATEVRSRSMAAGSRSG